MNNAIYIALSRQTGLFRNVDVVANNVANASTPGFKGETMVFEQFLANDKDNFRKKIAFSQDVATFTDFRSGPVTHTGRDLDVALDGEGFFKVETPQGVRYTRRGNFRMNAENNIVTADGFKVLGKDGQPLRLEDEDINIQISSDGTIRAGEVGEVRGQISIVHFKEPQKLLRVENGLYDSKEAPLTTEAPAKALQGTLEQSNVSPVVELTNMININRSVSGVTGFMADMHELTRRAMTAYTRTT